VPRVVDAEFQAQLAVFKRQFLARLDGTLAALDARLRGYGAAVPPTVLREVHAELHRLAGAGGIFGFAELSRQAQLLELQAQAWLDADAAIPAAEWERWRSALSGLRQSTHAGEQPKDAPPDGS
jgi:HPt (histidine-containing phosphotransfer) domain-containing protein